MNFTPAGILSDRQIKELCIPPTFIVRERVASQSAMRDFATAVFHMPTEQEYPTWKTEDELVNMRQSTGPDTIGISGWRKPTEEDLVKYFKPMITPFEPQQVRERRAYVGEGRFDNPMYRNEKIVSYGLSSAGYDVRLARKFKIFTNIRSVMIDPLNMSDECYVNHEGDYVIIPPHSYILGHTPEVFDVPRDVMVVCVGKSTYARAGCAVNVTPIEPGFKGQVVIEIANQTPLPMKVYADMGIAQFLFFKMSEPCETSYGDRGGKYQNQTGITTARV